MKSLRSYWPITLIIILSVVLSAFFLFDWWPYLRGGFGWRWPYVRPEVRQLARLIPAPAAIILYLYGVDRLRNSRPAVYLSWGIFGAILIPVALLTWWGDPIALLFSRTVSGLITGGFSVGVNLESGTAALRSWPQMMAALKPESIHIALSLPGWPLAYYGLTRLLENAPGLSDPLGMLLRPYLCHNIPLMNLSNAQLAAAWLGILSPLWAALTAVPLYLLGRAVANEPVAREAVVWWPLVPSLALFLGTLNTPTPLLATIIFYLLWSGLTQDKRGRNWRLLLSGALSAVALILTFAFIPLLLFAGILALATWQRDQDQSWLSGFRKPLGAGISFGLGLLFVFAVYTLLAGHTPLEILARGMDLHLDLQRRYWPWLLLHSWDFVIFLGLPAFGLFICGLTPRAQPRIRRLAWALAATLIIIVLSGTARGETGRLWIYFMPLALLVAADILVQLPAGLRYGLAAGQVLWLLILFTVLPTTGRGFDPPPAYAAVAFSPSPAPLTPAAADFDGLLTLQGYSAFYDAQEEAFVVDLQWQPQQQLAVPYFFSALLVAPDGTVLPAQDWQPFAYQYPTTCWHLPGTSLTDRISLPVPAASPHGDYWLSLSIFSLAPDGEPQTLPVRLPDGTQDTQVGLGPLLK